MACLRGHCHCEGAQALIIAVWGPLAYCALCVNGDLLHFARAALEEDSIDQSELANRPPVIIPLIQLVHVPLISWQILQSLLLLRAERCSISSLLLL